MAQKAYIVAVLVQIPADSYDEALREAEAFAAGAGDRDELFVSAVHDYETDNDGQRVLYLHPADEPVEAS